MKNIQQKNTVFLCKYSHSFRIQKHKNRIYTYSLSLCSKTNCLLRCLQEWIILYVCLCVCVCLCGIPKLSSILCGKSSLDKSHKTTKIPFKLFKKMLSDVKCVCLRWYLNCLVAQVPAFKYCCFCLLFICLIYT